MAGLNTREREVLRLLADHQSTGAIALKLGVTVGTLRKHIAKIYRILRVKNRTDAIAALSPSNSSPSRIVKTLSHREQKVLKLLADNQSTKDITLSLGIAMSTLRNHLTNIYHSLRVEDRKGAVALFRGNTSMPDRIAPSGSLPPPLPAGLSPREREALELLAKDQSREDIARNLGITEGTLCRLLNDIYRKLGVKNRNDAVATIRPSSAQLRETQIRLSPREQEVLKLLSEGQSTKDIARILDVSVGTVFVYTSNICRIIGVKTRAEAVLQFQSVSGAH
jgi:DNA-binding CsgD family transcriptional regulator